MFEIFFAKTMKGWKDVITEGSKEIFLRCRRTYILNYGIRSGIHQAYSYTLDKVDIDR